RARARRAARLLGARREGESSARPAGVATAAPLSHTVPGVVAHARSRWGMGNSLDRRCIAAGMGGRRRWCGPRARLRSRRRGGAEGRGVPVMLLVLIAAWAGWGARDHSARRDLEAEQRALDTRAFELATRAFMPGSALGCLDAIAGETVEGACEKALFASPEA